MSHLSTIIARVKNRLEIVYKGNIIRASGDSLWRQSIRNLREYQESWEDQTREEIMEANRIYELYKQYQDIHPPKTSSIQESIKVINDHLIARNLEPMTEKDLQDWGLNPEGDTLAHLSEWANDIICEEHTARCENKNSWRYQQ